MRILIGSAGRRVYLVRWFQQALDRAGVAGSVHITESSASAATAAFADGVHLVPRYEHPDYRSAMQELMGRIQPDLFFSVNDFELEGLAGGFAAALAPHCPLILSLPEESQRVVSDKFVMSSELAMIGVPTAPTILANDADAVNEMAEAWPSLVVKPREGSGSVGLRFIDATDPLRAAREIAEHTGPDAQTWVVQPRLKGQEYGLDLVTDLITPQLEGVLARRKLGMRSGETNVAETVTNERFADVAERIVTLLRPRGLIDIDVLDVGGEPTVIDINPRFGGGYPFNHAAGADVPAFYVSRARSLSPPTGWNSYDIGSVVAKYDSLAVVRQRP